MRIMVIVTLYYILFIHILAKIKPSISSSD